MQPGSFMPSLPKLKKDCYNSQEKRSNIVYTGTGADSQHYNNLMDRFKNSGYCVKLFFDVDKSVCIKRAD